MNEALLRFSILAQHAASDLLSRLKKPAHGQGLVEYALLLGLIAIGVIVAVKIFSQNVSSAYNHVGNCVNNAQTPTPAGTPTPGC